MTPERWQQIDALFHGALDLDPGQRDDYLDRACAHDAALRGEVAALLAQDAKAEREGFLAATPDPPTVLEGAGGDLGRFAEPVAPAGRYRAVRFHARGGLGEVYLAHDEQLGRDVALKRLQAQHGESPDSCRRFRVEAEVTARLEHPGIVPVHSLAEADDGRPGYVMRFVQGDTLAEALQRFHAADPAGQAAGARRLEYRQLLGRFVAVCNTVAYAHSRGVVHRDIKPSNILLGAYGETFLVDWGLAKRVTVAAAAAEEVTAEAGSGLETRLGCAMGTPAYMSPEQAAGRWDVVGPASDIYSLGATLYTLLTGQPPYPQGSVGEILARVQRGDCPPPQRVRRDTPRALDAICRKAMARKPEDRYATATALAAEVEHWLADEPVSAYRERWPARLARWGRRHRSWVASAAVLLLSAVVGLSLGLVLLGRANRRTEEQVAIATVVRDFLQNDLLRQADSWAQADRHFTPNPDIKVREVLDRAAQGIGERFRDQPVVEAAIRRAIGDAYLGLGVYEEAIRHLSAAADLCAAQLGPTHRDTLATQHNLACAYGKGGRTAEAIQLFEQVRAPLTSQLGPEDPETLGLLNSLACTYVDAGRTAEAIPLFEQVRGPLTTQLGPSHPVTLTTLENLAAAYVAAGRTAEAIPLFEQVRDQRTQTVGPGHPDTLLTVNNLAGAYLSVGRFADTIPLLEQVRAQRTQALGPDHPQTLTTLNNLAGAYLETGRSAEAIPLFEQVRAQQMATLGADHPQTLLTSNNLAGAYRDAGRSTEAIPLLEAVRAQQTRTLGPDHPDTLLTSGNLALAYQDTGRLAEAIPLFEQVRAQCTQALRPGHPLLLKALHNLADAYLDGDRGAEAIPLYEQVRDQLTPTLGPDHPDTLVTLYRLALAYQDAGRFQEAIEVFEQVHERRLRTLGPGHSDTLRTLKALAVACRDAGRLAEALQHFEQFWVQRRQALGSDDPQTLIARHNLAVMYRDAGRPAEALPLLEEVLARQRQVLGPDHRDTLITLSNLAATFQAAKQLDRAAALYRELLDTQARKLPADDPERADSLAAYGHFLMEAKQPGEAEPVLRECLAIREKKQPDAWTTSNTRSALGGSLARQQKYAEAEPLLVQGYEGLTRRERKIPASRKVLVREALDRLVELYDAWGKPDQAARWKAARDQLVPAR